MRVVHISTYGTGGAGKGALSLHQGLMEIGVDSHLIISEPISNDIENVHVLDLVEKQEGNRFAKFKNRLKKYLMNRRQAKINQGKESSYIFSFLETGINLSSHPLVLSADVIHLHWISKVLDWELFFDNSEIKGKKIFWTIHDRNIFTGGCHITYNCDGFQYDCKNCYQREGTNDINYPSKQLELKKELLKDIDVKIITPSTLMGKTMQSSSLFKNKPFTRIPYATNFGVFKALENSSIVEEMFNIAHSNKRIIFVSADVNYVYKGFSHLMEASKFFDFEDYQIITVGHPYLGDIDDRVIQLGLINDDRLINLLYNYVDFLALPCLEDNLPFTMLESLSSGTPVIAYPTGGVLDTIEEGFDGYVADIHEPKAFAEKVNIFYKSMENHDRKELYNRSKERFGKSVQASNVLKLYSDL